MAKNLERYNFKSESFLKSSQLTSQTIISFCGWVIEDIIKKPSTRMQLYELGNEKLTVREISEKRLFLFIDTKFC